MEDCPSALETPKRGRESAWEAQTYGRQQCQLAEARKPRAGLVATMLVATISQRDDTEKLIGRSSSFRVGTKQEAKQRAKTLARSLGLTVYGVVDKTGPDEEPHPWRVPDVGNSL
jgi:hypothetical protein